MGTLTFQAAAGGSLNLLGPNIAGTVNLTLPTADGTNGQALQTNGSGTLSFANLGTAAGGTGLTSFTSGGVVYASSTSALTTGSALTFDGTNFATTGTATATKLIPTGTSVTGNGMYLPATNSVGISTAGTNAVYIDASQNVGIGASSPTAKLNVNGIVHVTGAGSFPTTGTGIEIVSSSAGGTNYIQAYNRTGATWQNLEISSAQTVFGTGGSERIRITSAGDLLVGTTTSGGWSGAAKVESYMTTGWGISAYNNATSSGAFLGRVNNTAAALAAWYYSTTNVGSITTNGTVVVYGGTSDYRLKTIVGAVTGQGERIDALEPIEYKWNSNNSQSRGFLAHKFQEIYPQSVTGTKDALDSDGNPVYQGMQAGSAEVIADLIAEIQSLRKRLTALETA